MGAAEEAAVLMTRARGELPQAVIQDGVAAMIRTSRLMRQASQAAAARVDATLQAVVNALMEAQVLTGQLDALIEEEQAKLR